MKSTTLVPLITLVACGLIVAAAFAPPWSRKATPPDPVSVAPNPEPVPQEAPGPVPEGMVWIPGGAFDMGATDGFPDEQPVHRVAVDGFWLDEAEVTNAQFAEFVANTGYVTIAEKTPKREDFVGQIPDVNEIPEENLVAGSVCYNPEFDRTTFRKDGPLWPYQVWQYVKGANWRHPAGPDSSIEEKQAHPVVHVSHEDAVAYCRWAKKRLPTEAEWEFAARGGLSRQSFPWGKELKPEGKWRLNIWQGNFPEENTADDGFLATAPVRQFSPNGYGLYGVSGNVWEWCADFYRPDYYEMSPRDNPTGPEASFDPNEPGVIKRIQRGGSFMCSDNYCTGYRVSARMKGEPTTGTFHCGFRCALSSGK